MLFLKKSDFSFLYYIIEFRCFSFFPVVISINVSIYILCRIYINTNIEKRREYTKFSVDILRY